MSVCLSVSGQPKVGVGAVTLLLTQASILAATGKLGSGPLAIARQPYISMDTSNLPALSTLQAI